MSVFFDNFRVVVRENTIFSPNLPDPACKSKTPGRFLNPDFGSRWVIYSISSLRR